MTEQRPESGHTGRTEDATPGPRRFTALQALAIVLMAVVITLSISYLAVSAYLFPGAFKPVNLNPGEQRRLEHKLEILGVEDIGNRENAGQEPLRPEPYSEAGARREVAFTEREINGVLARNTDLARKVAIDLSNDLASANLLLPLDPEMPLFGGRTLKVSAGLELAMEGGRPRAILKGVSVWGVPLPNAWLGNLKNVDLIAEYGGNGGFWEAVAQGIEEIKVSEGRLRIKLRE